MTKIAVAILMLFSFPGSATAGTMDSGTSPIGLWQNPAGTLRVRTAFCGEALCGTIAAASPVAEADAKAAGVPSLLGIELLENYRKIGHNHWAGRVYVPDMGRSFSSRIIQTSPSTLKISGCLIGGFLCKSQIWKRL